MSRSKLLVNLGNSAMHEDKRFVMVTSEQMRIGVDGLAKKVLEEKGKPGCILGIGRGSLVMARLLSDSLDVGKIYLIQASRYRDIAKANQEVNVGDVPKEVGETKGYVLVVDDVSDKGDTLHKISDTLREYLKEKGMKNEVVTCTFAVKTETRFKPDFYAAIVDSDKWIIYPYEFNEILRSFAKSGDMEGIKFLKQHLR